jgi:hypothetical protein
MEDFRTVVSVESSAAKLALRQRLLCLGSCFAEHIGGRLRENRFDIRLNPTGILYNPASIVCALRRLWEGRPYERNELFEHAGLWRSFDHHSRFASPDPESCLRLINQSLQDGHECLRHCDWLMLTFGTAAAWFQPENPSRPVANCHKLPQANFRRRMLSVSEIVESVQGFLETLSQALPQVRILLTVSPIRHLRSDAHENLVSKSRLVLAVDELSRQRENVHYFPAYEIMLDDLRDYRFYERDMVHPSEVAQEYIWERFAQAFLTDEARAFLADYAPVLRGARHRWQQPTPQAMETFTRRQQERIARLEEKYPGVNLNADCAPKPRDDP